MSDSDSRTDPPGLAGSPLGCLFPLAAISVVAGLMIWIAVTGVIQNRRIAEFTQPEPMELAAFEPDRAQATRTQAKLARLRQAAETGEPATVTFTVRDLNTMIATLPVLASLRRTSRIETISAQGIVVAGSFRMRRLGGGFRYLNGRFRFVPARSETNAWQLELRDIEPVMGEIPDGFLQMFRNLHMFRFDTGRKELQTVLRQIERIELDEGLAVVMMSQGAPADP